MIMEFEENPFFWDGLRVQPVRVSDEYIRGSIPMHSHAADCLELHFILSGKGWVKTQTDTFSVNEGTFYVTLGGEAHEQNSDNEAPVRELCIYASLQRGKTTGEQAKTFLSHEFFIGRADEDMLHTAYRIAAELAMRRAGSADAVKFLFGLLLVCAARAETDCRSRKEKEQTGSSNDLFLKIEEAFLYEYRTVTLFSLSRKIGMSERQLQRILKERYGATFTEMRTKARMRAANLLLAEGALSVTRIAEETGYASIEHFCAEYKKIFAVTPREYRKRTRRA